MLSRVSASVSEVSLNVLGWLALRGNSTKVYGFGREVISLCGIHLLYFFYSSRAPWGFSNTCAEIIKLSGGSSSK